MDCLLFLKHLHGVHWTYQQFIKNKTKVAHIDQTDKNLSFIRKLKLVTLPL